MNKKAKIATITTLVIAVSILALMVFAAPKKCNNGADDDNDGLIDYPNDPGCSGSQDNTETSTSLICDDGIDQTNDRDTLADFRLSGGDTGCTSATDSSEINGDCDDLDDETNDRDTLTDSTDPGCVSTTDASEIDGICDDNADDASDADSLADGSDPGCTSFGDSSEVDGACDDLADNDGDTFTDYPSDPGCSSFSDGNETSNLQCDDNLDNSDRDTLVDYPDDAGCSSPSDNNETDGVCDDSVDDASDADTLGDATDPGCTSFSDTSEIDGQCDDKLDNDGDTHIDFTFSTRDSKCTSFSDNDESPSDFCSDTDGGIVSTTQGTVSGEDESLPFSQTDFCIDSTQLTEYYCGTLSQDYAPLSTTINCAGNVTTSCLNGACV